MMLIQLTDKFGHAVLVNEDEIRVVDFSDNKEYNGVVRFKAFPEVDNLLIKETPQQVARLARVEAQNRRGV